MLINKTKYSSPLLKSHPFCYEKVVLLEGCIHLEEKNLVVIYYLSASEIWPDKRGGLCWEWPDKRGGLCWEWPYKRGGLCWEWPYKRVTTK